MISPASQCTTETFLCLKYIIDAGQLLYQARHEYVSSYRDSLHSDDCVNIMRQSLANKSIELENDLIKQSDIRCYWTLLSHCFCTVDRAVPL